MKRTSLPVSSRVAAMALYALSAVSSCAGAQVTEDGQDTCDEEQAARTVRQLSKQNGDAESREKKLRAVVSSCRGTQPGYEALLLLARTLKETGRCNEVVHLVEPLVEDVEDETLASGLKRQLAICRLETGDKDKAAQELEKELETAETEEQKTKLAADIAEDLWNRGHYAQAVEYYASFYQGASESEKDFITKRVIEALDSKIPITKLKKLFMRLRDKHDFPKGYLLYKLAKVLYHTRQYSACQKLLARMLSEFPGHPLAADAKAFLERMQERFKVDPRSIGVILPLSGKYKVFGEKVLHAIELAADPFKKKGMALVIRDSAGNPDQAAKMVNDLVFNEHVIAIVGPLMSSTAKAAAMKAEQLSVPLVALSQAEGLPDIGTYVFRHFLTDEIMGEALAKYAVKELGYKKFAILFPDHPYGRGLMAAFWDSVRTLGGEVTACEAYPYDATTFTDYVKKLVGRYYVEARPEYWRFRAENKRKYRSPTRWRRALEKFLQHQLAPVIDFDALFIPDYYKTVSLIGPALAFEDIEVDQDNDYLKKRLEEKYRKILKRKLKLVRLLGANGWNNPKLIDRCDKYCRGAIFVDAWNPQSEDPEVQKFIASYTDSFGTRPGPIEAFGYDTLRMMRKVIENAKPDSREAMRNALVTMKPYKGITGETMFRSNGEAEKKLFIFKVGKENFEPQEYESPAPAGEEKPGGTG